MPKRAAKTASLQQRLAQLEHDVGREVTRALKKADQDLAKERAKLAKAVKNAEKQFAKKQRELQRDVAKAVKSAKTAAGREEHKVAKRLGKAAKDVEHLAQHGVWGSVDSLAPAKKRKGGKKKR